MKSIIISVLLFTLASANMACMIPGQTVIDLTHPFDQSTEAYPGMKMFELNFTYYGYKKEGYWLQTEDYGASIHIGTHLDAPCHIVKGKWTLDQIPISRFIAPAAVVDIRYRTERNRDANLEIKDLQNWEWSTGKSLDGTIVLVNTGWGKKWYNPKEFLGTTSNDLSEVHFPGIGPEAAKWIANNRNIYGLGIDTTSLDNGQAVHRKAHVALFEKNIFGIENVANLDQLPPYGSTVVVSPMKISRASGAPVRIYAFV